MGKCSSGGCERDSLPIFGRCIYHVTGDEVRAALSRTCDGQCDLAKRILDDGSDEGEPRQQAYGWDLRHWDLDGESGWRLTLTTADDDYWIDVTHCLCGGRLEAHDG